MQEAVGAGVTRQSFGRNSRPARDLNARYGFTPVDQSVRINSACRLARVRASGCLGNFIAGLPRANKARNSPKRVSDRNSLITSKYQLPLTVNWSIVHCHVSYQQPRAAVPVSAMNRGVRSSLFSIITSISSRSLSNVLMLTCR